MSVETSVLKEQIKLVRDLRSEKSELSAPVKVVGEKLDLAEAKLIELLNEAGLKSLPTEFGRATVVVKSSVRIPETPPQMIEFLEYVKSNDPELYANTVCMKSTDVNKYYELKLEEARAKGLDDLVIPGINGLSFRETLSLTKQ